MSAPQNSSETPPVATYYYLTEWSDEVMPCGPSLAEWAEWLSKPDADWGRAEPASPGQTFPASTLVVLANVCARMSAGALICDALPSATDIVFVRHGGPHTGWDADNSTFPGAHFGIEPLGLERNVEHLLIEELGMEDGESACLACCQNGPAVRVRYDIVDGVPTCTVEAATQ